MDEPTRQQLLQKHLDAIRALQAPKPDDTAGHVWPPTGFYWLFHVLAGMTLGFIGATVSLLVNIVGALLVGEPPLKLIQVYLTFPMGERALALGDNSGMILFVGCVLYLVTGAMYGILFHLIMAWYFDHAGFRKRLLIGSGIGLGLWIFNFYLVLSWLQPALLGGSWIVSQTPVWVGAGTHLVFAWTMLLVADWGRFTPFRNR